MRTYWLSEVAARNALACCICTASLMLAACFGDAGVATSSGASVSAGSGSSSVGSSGSSAETSTDAVPPVPGITSAVNNLTLALPAGVTLTPDKLKVMTSAASAIPDITGAVSVTAFTPGSQLAIVLTPVPRSSGS